MISLTKKNLLQNGKYSISEELREGQIDRIYKAVNLVQNRSVVIKTFKTELLKEAFFSSNLTKMSLKQAQKFIKCHHPNLVRFEDFFIEDGLPYIVTDYIVGTTLDKIITPENPLPEATAIKYIRQIGKGLEVLHSNGLLHRNIRPKNLILPENKQIVVLIDLGLIDYCTLRKFEQRGLIKINAKSISNRGYTAIEQYLPEAEQTFATDVYSLAATLYTLVTGYTPTASVLRPRMPIVSPGEFCSNLSTQICEAIMHGMAIEAEDRPSSVSEWLALLPRSDRNLVGDNLNMSLDLDRQIADVYNSRGLVYRNEKKWQLALTNYSKAIAIDPNCAKAYNNRGVVYSILKKWDLALADYAQSVRIDPDLANVYYNRGNVYFYQQKWELAIANYTKTVDLDPDYGAAYYNRGQIWRQLKHQPKAIADFQTAAQLFQEQDNLAAYQETIDAIASF